MHWFVYALNCFWYFLLPKIKHLFLTHVIAGWFVIFCSIASLYSYFTYNNIISVTIQPRKSYLYTPFSHGTQYNTIRFNSFSIRRNAWWWSARAETRYEKRECTNKFFCCIERNNTVVSTKSLRSFEKLWSAKKWASHMWFAADHSKTLDFFFCQ
jgi:hypothetical protein